MVVVKFGRSTDQQLSKNICDLKRAYDSPCPLLATSSTSSCLLVHVNSCFDLLTAEKPHDVQNTRCILWGNDPGYELGFKELNYCATISAIKCETKFFPISHEIGIKTVLARPLGSSELFLFSAESITKS